MLTEDTPAKKAAKRKAKERQRKRESGLVPVEEWVKRKNKTILKRFAETLR